MLKSFICSNVSIDIDKIVNNPNKIEKYWRYTADFSSSHDHTDNYMKVKFDDRFLSTNFQNVLSIAKQDYKIPKITKS